MKVSLRIGVAYDLLRWEEKAIIEAIKRLGHEPVLIYVPASKLWVTERSIKDVDFVLERCVSFYRALASSMVIQEHGIPVINPYEVIRDCGDKLLTTLRLSKSGLPIPKTAIAFDRSAVIELAKELGYPLVIKPVHGSWGRMIARALDEQSLHDIMDFRENMPSPQFQVHYVQEFVRKPGRDIRAYYVWGDVPVAIYRVSQNWKTNTALGARAEPAELSDEAKELVRRAGEVMGGGILGVDIMENDEGKMLIAELNAIVEFKNTVRVTGYDLPGKIISSTVQMLRS